MKANAASRKGTPLDTRLARLSQADTETGCTIWTGAINWNGYGHIQIMRDGRKVNTNAHRAAYELARGAIPPKAVVDHLCRNRACINPDHLEAVSCGENLLRGKTFNAENAAKTHCVNGHPLSGDNLRQTGRQRNCRACGREKARAYRARKARA